MSSVVDGLNQLLARERGELEAVAALLDEIEETDPDIAEGAADVLSAERWSCTGLCHRIMRLHGTPTLDSTDLAQEMAAKVELKDKLRLLCRAQKADVRQVRSLMADHELDDTTRDFLADLLRAHEETAAWCESMLSEWKVERGERKEETGLAQD